MNIDKNDLTLKFAFGEKEDFYFSHIIDCNGNICIELRFAKEVFSREQAFNLASNLYVDYC